MDTTTDTSKGTDGAEPYATMPTPATVTIERILPGPVERAWAYIAESDKRRKWFAEGPMDLRQGGAVALTFRNNDLSVETGRRDSNCSPDGVDHQMNGEILRCEPPRLLVFRWSPDATASEVTFELSPHGSDTRMLVTHRRLADRRQLLSVSAGWHVHIGILMDLLSEQAPRSFWSEHARLERVYSERFAE
jgi:uncharacterized protein YndB with AHSA1/START domain